MKTQDEAVLLDTNLEQLEPESKVIPDSGWKHIGVTVYRS